jgi:hypothetical protein
LDQVIDKKKNDLEEVLLDLIELLYVWALEGFNNPTSRFSGENFFSAKFASIGTIDRLARLFNHLDSIKEGSLCLEEILSVLALTVCSLFRGMKPQNKYKKIIELCQLLTTLPEDSKFRNVAQSMWNAMTNPGSVLDD